MNSSKLTCLLFLIFISSSFAMNSKVLIHSSNDIPKEINDNSIYNDKDIQNLILNNIGLLDNLNLNNLPFSSKSIINNHGNQNLFSSSILNYIFMIETNHPLIDILSNTNMHSSVQADICAQPNEECLFDMIFSKSHDSSIHNAIESFTSKSPKNLNLYSSKGINNKFEDFGLALITDENDALRIYDGSSRKSYSLKENLQQCVGEVLGAEYDVDIEKGILSAKKNTNGANTIIFDTPEKNLAFNDFMKDICAIHAVSSLIANDQNEPTVLTFYLSSYGKIEDIVDESNVTDLQKILNLTYQKFLSNLNIKFNNNEISGQVITTKTSTPLASALDLGTNLSKYDRQFPQARLLAKTTQTTNTATTTQQPGDLIRKLFEIPAIIVLALILISFFNMEVYRDTLVYAKFLAIDSKQ